MRKEGNTSSSSERSPALEKAIVRSIAYELLRSYPLYRELMRAPILSSGTPTSASLRLRSGSVTYGGSLVRVPTFRDVIKSGSFAAPMTNWVTLAAAVSKPEFDGQLRRALDWEVKQFRRYGVDVGDYEALARRIRPNGLVRKKNESAEAFCRRIFMRRPSWQKSPQDALGPRGRRWPAG